MGSGFKEIEENDLFFFKSNLLFSKIRKVIRRDGLRRIKEDIVLRLKRKIMKFSF